MPIVETVTRIWKCDMCDKWVPHLPTNVAMPGGGWYEVRNRRHCGELIPTTILCADCSDHLTKMLVALRITHHISGPGDDRLGVFSIE